jgi:hypothetical protein
MTTSALVCSARRAASLPYRADDGEALPLEQHAYSEANNVMVIDQQHGCHVKLLSD